MSSNLRHPTYSILKFEILATILLDKNKSSTTFCSHAFYLEELVEVEFNLIFHFSYTPSFVVSSVGKGKPQCNHLP